MTGYLRHISRGLMTVAASLLVAALASCYGDSDYASDSGGGLVKLQMSVSTHNDDGGAAGAVTRDGTEPGDVKENIHSLCVLLVGSDGNIAWKYLNDNLSDNASRSEYISEPIEIQQGSYDVYAFANFDYYSDFWENLNSLREDQPFAGDDFNSMVIDDPAGKIDFGQGHFIPMSGKKTNVLVTRSTRIIPVELDRLVGKVHITIAGGSVGNVTSLTFKGWADKVPLFSDGNVENAGLDMDTTFIVGSGDAGSSIEGGQEEIDIPAFYVNETAGGAPFSVEVTTEDNGAGSPTSVYTATTGQRGLPRNYIYPLIITVNDWQLDITARCWVSPIGIYPVPVKADFEPDTYNIRIPEGAQFEFTLNGLDGIDNSKCTWSIDPKTTQGIAFEGNYTGGTTVKGHVTASAGNKYQLGVEATWSENNNSYKREYTINMETTDISDAEFRTTTRAAGIGGGLIWLAPEVLDISTIRL